MAGSPSRVRRVMLGRAVRVATGRRTRKLAASTVRLTIYLVFQGRALRDWDPTSVSLSGLALVQLAIGVLGVLVITSEYSTGSMQTSLAAVPRRGSRLVAGPPDVIASECVRATPACRAAVRGPMMPVWLAPTAAGFPAAGMSNPDIEGTRRWHVDRSRFRACSTARRSLRLQWWGTCLSPGASVLWTRRPG